MKTQGQIYIEKTSQHLFLYESNSGKKFLRKTFIVGDKAFTCNFNENGMNTGFIKDISSYDTTSNVNKNYVTTATKHEQRIQLFDGDRMAIKHFKSAKEAFAIIQNKLTSETNRDELNIIIKDVELFNKD